MGHDSDGLIAKGRYFELREDPSGVEFVRCGDEVLVVPLSAESAITLIEEPSAAFGAPTWVTPGGSVEEGEAHAVTANRELQEEIGLLAERVDPIGELRPFSKYLSVRSFVYLARDLVPSSLVGDENYENRQRSVPLDSLEEEVRSGRVLDARVIAALFLTRDFLKSQTTG